MKASLLNYSCVMSLAWLKVGAGRQLPVKEVQVSAEEIQGQSQEGMVRPRNHVTAGGNPEEV